MGITIVGLGPSNGRLMTREAWDVVCAAETLYARTTWHPVIDELAERVEIVSYDHLYDTEDDFAAVYQQIVTDIVERAAEGAQIVYAVPGHPFIGESTTPAILRLAQAADIPVRIIDGISFAEPTITILNQYIQKHEADGKLIDGMSNFQICDALELLVDEFPQINVDASLLVGQVYSQLVASELKLLLMAIFDDEHPVYLVHGASAAEAQVESIPLYEIDRSKQIGHLTSLYVPPRLNASNFAALSNVVAVLRGPDGCPWDQEQTPQSLREGLIEEVSEVLEALDREDPEALCEELGDVLLHVSMQAQMASEMGDFNIGDVVEGIVDKMIRRHPHVWGDAELSNSSQVVDAWEAIKKNEKGDDPRPLSVLDNIPATLPALAQSHKIQKRVRKVGFDWQHIEGVYEKLQEEVVELQTAETHAERMMELGDLLFVIVNLAKWLKLDPESALREANLRFSRRFRLVEKLTAERGLTMNEMSEAELTKVWLKAKEQLADIEQQDNH